MLIFSTSKILTRWAKGLGLFHFLEFAPCVLRDRRKLGDASRIKFLSALRGDQSCMAISLGKVYFPIPKGSLRFPKGACVDNGAL
jgi:hypothetical protein